MKLWFSIFLITFTISVKGQSANLSSFSGETPSTALYSALNSKIDTLVMDLEGSPWIFEPMRLEGIKDKIIILEKGVTIMAKSNAFPKPIDALFKFIDCDNITILGNENTISMNKEEYLDGEWRHVIRLRGSRGFRLENVKLCDSGGDGISIGDSKKRPYSENIILKNIQSINNKRQGISIVSAKNVHVSHSIFAETKGTLPGAGVDIEPDKPGDVISNIIFDTCTFRDNYHAGIKIALVKLQSYSEPVSITFQNCYLTNNFSEDNPKNPSEIFIRSHKTDPVLGEILFTECRVEKSKWGMLYAQKNALGFTVRFDNCSASDICRIGPRSAIYLEVPHYREQTDLGGFDFDGLQLDYRTKGPWITVQGARSGSLNSLKNIKGEISVPADVSREINYIEYSPAKNKDVNLTIIHRL